MTEQNAEEVRKEWFRQGKEEGKRLATIDHAQTLMRKLHLSPEEVLEMLEIPKTMRKSMIKILTTRLRQKPEKFSKP